jgi:hypothetical protein
MHELLRWFRLLILAALAACSAGLDDSEQIRATIEAMELAVEAGEARRFAGFLVEDFQGQDGITDRRSARAFVARQLVSQQKIRVQLGPVRVVINENTPAYAAAEFEALLLGGPRILPDSGQIYRIDTQWRKENGKWLLVSAHWERAIK